MKTTADFKRQIAKPFGQEMRMRDYKGTGFEYRQETDNYLIAVLSTNGVTTKLLPMTTAKAIYFLAFLMLTLTACGQQQNARTILGKSHAENELKSALSDRTRYNLVDNKTVVIKDSVTAISVAEPVLFSIYGKDNIIRQRPYETYFIDQYWIISGTLPEKSVGGTFLIIMDARNNQIIKITHGK
jgi:hypothetical protein